MYAVWSTGLMSAHFHSTRIVVRASSAQVSPRHMLDEDPWPGLRLPFGKPKYSEKNETFCSVTHMFCPHVKNHPEVPKNHVNVWCAVDNLSV